MKKFIKKENIKINYASVKRLFEERNDEEDSIRAIMLETNKGSNLPAMRNEYDRQIIINNIHFYEGFSVLDVGCGAGRLAHLLPPDIDGYVGFDAATSMIKRAQKEFQEKPNFNFLNIDLNEFARTKYAQKKYNLIFCVAFSIYVNDVDLVTLYEKIAQMTDMKENSYIFIRESLSREGDRLTLKEHYSDGLQMNYSAIYRTDAEYKELFKPFFDASFELVQEEFFPEELQNRTETGLKYYLFKREKL